MLKSLLGQSAESRAPAFLKTQGLKLVARNWRSRFGEIDLIMQDDSTLVFIEVGLGGRSDLGSAGDRASISGHAENAAAVPFRRGRTVGRQRPGMDPERFRRYGIIATNMPLHTTEFSAISKPRHRPSWMRPKRLPQRSRARHA